MGERISREYVMPMFVGVAALVALLVTYPYGTLTLLTLLYLGRSRSAIAASSSACVIQPCSSTRRPQPAPPKASTRLSGKELPGARDTKH